MSEINVKLPNTSEADNQQSQETQNSENQNHSDNQSEDGKEQSDDNQGSDSNGEFNSGDFLKNQFEKIGGSTSEDDNTQEESQPKPVDAYTWAEKTGRSPEEFFKLNKDWGKENQDVVLKEFYKETNPDLSEAEIDFLINKEYGVSDVDDEEESMSKTIEKKKAVRNAIEHFDKVKSEMGLGVKSDAPSTVPKEYEEAVNFQKTFQEQQTAQAEAFSKGRREYLQALIEHDKSFDGIEVGFNTEVNGMKRDVSLKYNPSQSDRQKIVEVQSDTNQLFAQFSKQNEDGSVTITDHKGLFNLIAKAVVHDDFGKFMFEQGAAMATESMLKNDLKRPNYESRGSQSIADTSTISVSSEKGTRQ